MILPGVGTKVAVVTGANKGIGYCTALQLALSGVFRHVILGCRDLTLGQEAVASMTPIVPPQVGISVLPLTIGDPQSHSRFVEELEDLLYYETSTLPAEDLVGSIDDNVKVDVLVNNAAIAFKGSDPTPFLQQTKPTLDVNFRGTVDFTEEMLPLLRKAGRHPDNDITGARIVNVASMAGGLDQLGPHWQDLFTDPALTFPQLYDLVNQFETDVQAGVHLQNGWSNSNYGMSKLAVVAATKLWAREEASNNIRVNCVCPGYCATDMSSGRGTQSPEEGARNVVLPALMEDAPTGEFFANLQIREW